MMSKTKPINFILELITYNFGHLGFSKWIVDTGEFLNIKIIYIIIIIYIKFLLLVFLECRCPKL